jgi:hypothetical protein
MIRFAWFPHRTVTPAWALGLVDIFRNHEGTIGTEHREHALTGEEVLAQLAADLRAAGFTIERRTLSVPRHDTSFHPEGAAPLIRHQIDVFHPQWLCSLAIETAHGSAAPEHPGELVDPLLVIDTDTLCLALPNMHAPVSRSPLTDFESACALAGSIYGHLHMKMPYRLLIIGY